jgi:hypothetical protein
MNKVSLLSNGIGIPDKELENIFQPFYRVHKNGRKVIFSTFGKQNFFARRQRDSREYIDSDGHVPLLTASSRYCFFK